MGIPARREPADGQECPSYWLRMFLPLADEHWKTFFDSVSSSILRRGCVDGDRPHSFAKMLVSALGPVPKMGLAPIRTTGACRIFGL